jgi:hypothetical protein
MKEEFNNLLEKLKAERDEIGLKLHLASMEVKQEFEASESTWQALKSKGSELVDGSAELSEDVLAKGKIVAEELKETYQRIANRLSE